MKKIYLIPVFNEERYLQDFIDDIKKYSCKDDIFLFIDDNSCDKSLEILRKNIENKDIIIKNMKNKGLGTVLKIGFDHIKKMNVDDETIVITLDSDNQHDFSKIEEYVKIFKQKKIDAMFLARKMDLYPLYKRLGNKILSLWTSFLLKRKIKDVETGFRILNYRSIKKILKYYKGYRYSCAQELMVISGVLGLKMNNDIYCDIKHYRSNTTIFDFFINAFIALKTYIFLTYKGD